MNLEYADPPTNTGLAEVIPITFWPVDQPRPLTVGEVWSWNEP